MKKEYLDRLKQISPNLKEEDIILTIEGFFISEYGSRENFINYFKENNKNPVEEFTQMFDLEILERMSKSIFESNSLTDLLKNVSNLINNNSLDKDKLRRNLENIKKLQPELTNTIDLTESRIQVSLIPFLEDKLKFSLSKTRKELGYPDKRTFDKWLSVFFKDKFANRGENNGRISLIEYIEIVSAFMLSDDEGSFGDVKLENLEYRFKNQRSIHKKELKKLTNNNYALLKVLLDDKNIKHDLKLPENFRKMPYSIAVTVKEHIKQYF